MKEPLIPYTTNETGELIISARSLHEFLQIKTKFGIWMSRIIEYGFEENEDYNVVIQKYQTDYLLKVDMAKEICILQRTERGRQARLYFINLEKQFNSPESILKRLVEIVNLEFSQNQSIYTTDREILVDKDESLDEQTTSKCIINNCECNCENVNDLFTNFRDTAKMFGIKERVLIDWLILNDFCYRDNSKRIRPRAKYMTYFQLKPFRSPTGYVGVHTLINASGRDLFANLLAGENLIEVENMNIL